MRTTVTLEPDVEALVKRLMNDRGLTFKQAVNEAIRRGIGTSAPAPRGKTPTFAMGFDPALPLEHALRLAGELEDEELTRRLAVRK